MYRHPGAHMVAVPGFKLEPDYSPMVTEPPEPPEPPDATDSTLAATESPRDGSTLAPRMPSKSEVLRMKTELRGGLTYRGQPLSSEGRATRLAALESYLTQLPPRYQAELARMLRELQSLGQANGPDTA